MLPIQFDFQVREDRRGVTFEGLEAGRPDPEGAFHLQVRVGRDHLVLSVWPIRGEITKIAEQLTEILWPPRSTPSVCGFGDCQDDDRDALTQTTMWEFDPASRAEILLKVRAFLGLTTAT